MDVSGCTSLESFACASNLFTTISLNALFETLHSNTFEDLRPKSIQIHNNPGIKDCNRSIAVKKGSSNSATMELYGDDLRGGIFKRIWKGSDEWGNPIELIETVLLQ